MGPKAARALVKVARPLPANAVRGVFPEFAAGRRAIERLRDDAVPEGFDTFDLIVVDEVQDPTRVETGVVVERRRAIAPRHGRAPWLLLAGDAGHTVRPTGFDWGPLNDLLARWVRAPVRFHLEEQRRCPSRIAEGLEGASERYADVVKEHRPTKRRQAGGSRSRLSSRTCRWPPVLEQNPAGPPSTQRQAGERSRRAGGALFAVGRSLGVDS